MREDRNHKQEVGQMRFLRTKYVAATAAVGALVGLGLSSAAALATESEGATKVKEVATSVGTEGVTIVLAVLAALATLIAITIILPKAVKMIKRFI